MDIDEIRRTNLRAIEDKMGPAIYKLAGMSPAQFYNLRDGAKDSKTGKRRGMRKETAWKLEDAAGLPRGYLDVIHSNQIGGLHPNNQATFTPPHKTRLSVTEVVHGFTQWIQQVDPGQRKAVGESLKQLAIDPSSAAGCIAILKALAVLEETKTGT
jgi:hypothetical protein